MSHHRCSRPTVLAATLAALLLAAPLLAALAGPAAAGDVTGVWQRSDGVGSVRFAPCGNGKALCGTIIGSGQDGGRRYNGTQVFIDMAPTGPDAWTGTALNPKDGRTYAATMTISGDHLLTRGCVLGGLICKTISWSRQG